MSSPSPRIGLKRPLGADGWLLQDFVDNFNLLDAMPGVTPCTSGAGRPSTWGASQNGMYISETDTGLLWRWNGSIFVRAHPVGLLADPSEIAADFPTASTTAVAAITANVTVPATTAGSTTKRIRVSASWYALDNGTSTTLGACEVSLWRGAVALKTMQWRGRPNTAASPLDWGTGGTIEAWDAPAAGAQTYTLRVNSLASIGGTTYLRASPTTKATLAVIEEGL